MLARLDARSGRMLSTCRRAKRSFASGAPAVGGACAPWRDEHGHEPSHSAFARRGAHERHACSTAGCCQSPELGTRRRPMAPSQTETARMLLGSGLARRRAPASLVAPQAAPGSGVA